MKLDQMMTLLEQRNDCRSLPATQLSNVEKLSGNEKTRLDNVNELQREVSKLLVSFHYFLV